MPTLICVFDGNALGLIVANDPWKVTIAGDKTLPFPSYVAMYELSLTLSVTCITFVATSEDTDAP